MSLAAELGLSGGRESGGRLSVEPTVHRALSAGRGDGDETLEGLGGQQRAAGAGEC